MLCEERGVTTLQSYSSEREDWIQNMVAGGLGICFIPEYSAVIPGLQVRPVAEPEVSREVCLVTVAGRRFSPAVLTFVNAVKSYGWAEGPNVLSMQRSAPRHSKNRRSFKYLHAGPAAGVTLMLGRR